jgi:HEAT repeat protein
MRILVGGCYLLVLILVCAGCGERPAANAQKPDKKKRKLEPPPSQPAPKFEIDANKYPSLDAALADVKAIAARKNDPKAGQELLITETWIVRQGDKNVSALAERVADDGEDLAVRMTACRALSKLGAPGRAAVTAATDSPKKELRVKAIECLGRIDPVDKTSVDKLIVLLDDKDNDVRRAALLGLTATGKDGSKATNKLQNMLNDVKEDDRIRDLVKGALKAVDPRKGLMGADKSRE